MHYMKELFIVLSRSFPRSLFEVSSMFTFQFKLAKEFDAGASPYCSFCFFLCNQDP